MIRHFTATAFIVDRQKRTLLLWHKRLQRWMPTGGHIDPNETPEETARRECKEETGLDVEILGIDELRHGNRSSPDLFANNPSEGRMLKSPLAMLLEEIPACPGRNEPAHQHMDFLFVAKPMDESQEVKILEAESEGMRWFTRDDVSVLDESKEIFSNVKAYILQLLR
jgi:8-oxo-dGTP pyrophosphatase MutT (NUDIX family)